MVIKQAQINDLSEILELQKLCYTENAIRYNDFSISPITQTQKEIEKEFNTSFFLNAMEDQRIVGSIRALEKDGTIYIGRVIVHPEYQNMGIGHQLMQAIEGHFKSVTRFELFTGNKDEKNLYLYQKLGYLPFKKNYINDKLSLVYLEKRNDPKYNE
jgi:ribosomal protein S18 acetylase RimI-like enzyme